MKIVFDTNVIISAIAFGGLPLKAIDTLAGSLVSAFASPEIIEEYRMTLSRILQKYPDRPPHHSIESIIQEMHVLPSRSHIEICRDPDDNKFIECAVDNKCIYIVSGDKDLLVLERYEDIEILTVSDFLKQYETKQQESSTKKG